MQKVIALSQWFDPNETKQFTDIYEKDSELI
jgi:hypothetical protein